LLHLISTPFPASAVVSLVESLVKASSELLGDAQAIEVGIVTPAQALHLPTGAAPVLFVWGRVIGWIGHAIEEYQARRLIRPRARYVGPCPPR
jgi:citrate synthase